MNSKLELCYVSPDGDRAWFTNQPREAVWGDDWDEFPCQSSGPPYQSGRYDFVELSFESELSLTTGPSVDDINYEQHEIPWMRDWNGEPAIVPWMTMEDFVETIEKFGGKVFVPFDGF